MTNKQVTYFSEFFANKFAWHKLEQQRYPFHPMVVKVLGKGFTPRSIKALVREWPHVSVHASEDETKMAYTRSPEHGERDRQTPTSVARYIRQHFADIKDHEIRDVVGLVGSKFCSITNNLNEMIRAVQEGPYSCMTEFDDDDHPYKVYEPKLGWSMAIRKTPITDDEGAPADRIDGRALIYTYEVLDKLTPSKRSVFVRSYKRNIEERGGYSYADETLEAFMLDQGIDKLDGWPEGTVLAHYPYEGRYSENKVVCPYIDGDIQTVNVVTENDTKFLHITCKGVFTADVTDGYAYKSMEVCDSCDDECDSRTATGYYGDNWVCESCLDYNYHLARGRGGNEYYEHEEECIQTESGYYYVLDFIDSNGVVELKDGEYERENDCVKDWEGDWLVKDNASMITYGDHEGEWVSDSDMYTDRINGVFFVYLDEENHDRHMAELEKEEVEA